MYLFTRRQQNDVDLHAGDFFDCQDAFGHGWFQRGVAIFASFSMLVLHCHTQAFMLISRDLDHWCRPPGDVNMSLAAWKNMAIPLDADGTSSHCLVYSDFVNPNNTETVSALNWAAG
ncbi:hypothetical protein HPB48_018764 [Haemaphysalis longicornis]|uniref:Uncharacterized protein n=1 Tax=Haemaphysalis longicornis TaxID=44386 RepID=A0A9J6G6F3_HAELO|nr:hypothetical protein HPB48_018764 [Haemaphysalis longicornis]